MALKCDGCGKAFIDNRYLHRHEAKCARLSERNQRTWKNLMHSSSTPTSASTAGPSSQADSSSKRSFFSPSSSMSSLFGSRKKQRAATLAAPQSANATPHVSNCSTCIVDNGCSQHLVASQPNGRYGIRNVCTGCYEAHNHRSDHWFCKNGLPLNFPFDLNKTFMSKD